MPTEPPRRMCAPSTICTCGSGSAVRLYGHQLCRSPDSRPAFAISQGDLSLDKHRLREPAYRVPDCVFSGPNGVREIYGSRGHPARIEPVRSLVLDGFDRHFSFPRVYSFAMFRFLLGAGESANWPMRRRPCPSGFRNRRERWPRHFSTAVLPLAARSLLLLSCQSISVGDGVRCSSFRDC